MGRVRMTEYGSLLEFQETYEIDVIYTYCDKCGSFCIERKQYKQSEIKTLISTAGTWIFIVALAWLFLAALLKPSWIIASLIGIIGVIAMLWGVPKTSLKCSKCGNEHITDQNVLNLCGDDRSVIDAPDELIIKHYTGSKGGWVKH